MVGRFPALARPGYAFWSWFVCSVFGRAPVRPGLARRYFQFACRANLALSVRNRELKRRLTPQDQPMCKRLVFSSGYYGAVQKPDVEVITDRIDHIEPRGVVTADGALHQVDLMVFATGFDARAYVRPMTIRGEDGLSLDEAWADGPHAYRSVAVPGFPNLFMLMGPHLPIGNQSLIPIAKDQARLRAVVDQADPRRPSGRGGPDLGSHQAVQRGDQGGHAADRVADRLQQLVSGQGRPARAVPMGTEPPPRTPAQPGGRRLRGAQLPTAAAFLPSR
jgi:cation diffusion facilitator CzcD-associated flavoprotein CzcO